MVIGPQGLALIKHFEGFVPHRYQNAGDVPTIGYGTTAGAGVVNPLPETCTEEQATVWLEEYVNRAVIPAIHAAAEQGAKHFTQAQIDALADLGYNCGAGIFANTHTIGYRIRHGYTNGEISSAFLLYEAGDGVAHLAGLVTRREAERALFDRRA